MMNCHMTEPRSLQTTLRHTLKQKYSQYSQTHPQTKENKLQKYKKTKQKQIPQKITQPNQTNKVRTKFGSQSQQYYTNRLTDKCS